MEFENTIAKDLDGHHEPISKRAVWFGGVFLAILLGYLSILIQSLPPSGFPVNQIIEIPEGSTLSEIALFLEEGNLIRSAFIFNSYIRLSGKADELKAGEYRFEHAEGTFAIAKRIANGDFGLLPIKVRIPEGSTLKQMAAIMAAKLEQFDSDDFLTRSEGLEGFLFPDTYSFLENVRAGTVIETMQANFDEQLEPLMEDIEKSDLSLHELVTMASIIEREAWIIKDRHLIAGVLYNRLEINMPLQVDAVFDYIIGKTTFDLTLSDLKIESPYNTYVNVGLPPGPIGSPSLSSIKAALYPEDSNYFYYLADSEGTTHYATDFEGHKANRRLYLD